MVEAIGSLNYLVAELLYWCLLEFVLNSDISFKRQFWGRCSLFLRPCFEVLSLNIGLNLRLDLRRRLFTFLIIFLILSRTLVIILFVFISVRLLLLSWLFLGLFIFLVILNFIFLIVHLLGQWWDRSIVVWGHLSYLNSIDIDVP